MVVYVSVVKMLPLLEVPKKVPLTLFIIWAIHQYRLCVCGLKHISKMVHLHDTASSHSDYAKKVALSEIAISNLHNGLLINLH